MLGSAMGGVEVVQPTPLGGGGVFDPPNFFPGNEERWFCFLGAQHRDGAGGGVAWRGVGWAGLATKEVFGWSFWCLWMPGCLGVGR